MWVYSAFLPACLYIPMLRIRNISKNTVQEILIQSLQTKVWICHQEPLWYLQELPITSPSEALGCFTLLWLLCIQQTLDSEFPLCMLFNLYTRSPSCLLLILSLSSTDLIEAAGTQLWLVLWHLYFTVLHLHMNASWGLVFLPTIHASHFMHCKTHLHVHIWAGCKSSE